MILYLWPGKPNSSFTTYPFVMENNDTDQITLNAAIAYTTAWRDAPTKPNFNSFLVPLQDLLGIIEEHRSMGAEHARVYMAIMPDATYGTLPKLLFVGADANEDDILPTLNDPNNPDSKIWDVVKPCPPVCGDLSSPLATGTIG